MKRLTILIIKYIPIILSLFLVIEETFILNDIINLIFKVLSIIILSISLFILSHTFKFCIYHKIIIGYLTIWYLLKTIYIISFSSYYLIFMLFTFIILALVIIAYVKYGDRNV